MGAAGGSPVMALAATGFKMASDKYKAEGEAQGDVYKAEALEQQAQYGELKATQTSGQMTRNLALTLGHIDAVRAASHTDMSSPTGAAIRGEVEATGTQEKGIRVANIEEQVRTDRANAAYLRDLAGNALQAGNLAMVGDLFSGLAGAVPSMQQGGAEPTPGPNPDSPEGRQAYAASIF